MTKNSHQSCYFANNSKLPIVKGKDFHWLKLPMDQTTAWPKMKTGLEELKDGKKAQLTGHYTSAIDQTLRDAVNHSWLDTLFSTEVAKKSRATFARRIMDIGCGFAIGCLLHRVMAYAWNSLGQTKN
ncbi:MAG: hypothetical protein M1549_02140 [Candidatus Dependentiae bacterium]|nr:hypothetical protein [Candidatus Dependentiae bacterium]